MKSIFRYLRHTSSVGLHFAPKSSFTLWAFSDADYVDRPDDCKSTGGFCIYFGGHLDRLLGFKKRLLLQGLPLKPSTSLSPICTTCEILWLQSLVKELEIFLTHSPTLWCDNLGVTYLSVNPMLHSRTKHMKLYYHFV